MSEVAADAKEVFLQALDCQAPEELASFLQTACDGDDELRARVNELLDAHRDAGKFLQGRATGETNAFESIAECAGTIIGPYKLLQQIGEGGMGVVFMAEQTRPVQRTVALKIIKPGMDTRQVIARFEAERQALALMDHPNIAKVLDAGTTAPDDGGHAARPYFVMELVKGVPITEYCDEHRLTPRERLQLFVPVCQAVQHAHQKAIIHRDLKPSNVMIALYDGRPVPKIIDFGVAKATGPKLTERTMFTEFGALVGTFEYMSPEQAVLNQLDIDTRSDIYSLGVLLYELLTGETPFDRKRLHSVPFYDMLRIIREEEPPRPSTRLTTLAQQAASTVSAQRSSDPQRLSMLIRGELDWIVMKCLDKDRNRRYESANSLVADIERYLNDEPVQACPPSALYRMGKFARRNKAAFAIASVIAVAMLFGVVSLATSTIFISQAKDSVQQALDRERRTTYFQRVALAEREWSSGNPGRAVDLLNQCPQDLRGWEWRYLQRLRAKSLPPLRHESGVLACAVSPDGSEIASVDEDGYVKIWDSATAEELRSFRGHDGVIWCVAYSPDGVRLATGDRSGQVKIWDARTAKELRAWTMPGRACYIAAVAFDPEGRRLACAHNWEDHSSFSSTTTIWDPLTGEPIQTLPRQDDYVQGIAFSPDGRHLASACMDDTVRIFDVLTGSTVQTFHASEDCYCVAFSPDGRLIAVGSGGPEWDASGTITIWEVATGARRPPWPGHGAKGVAFSPDGQRLATGGTDLTVRIWDVASGQEALTLRGHTDYVRTVAFTPDGNRLISASGDNTIRIWDATPWRRGEKRGEELMTLRGHTAGLNAVAFHPKESRLLTGASDGAIKTWDTTTGRELSSFSTGLSSIDTLAFGSGGSRMAYAGMSDEPESSGSAVLVDTSSGKQLRRLGRHFDAVLTIAFSPDGKRLASGGGDGVAMISDVATGEVIHNLKGHRWYVTLVAFSPEAQARVLASAGEQLVRLWDATTGRELDESPLRHEGYVEGLAFSPDGQFLASSAWDGMVRIWDTKTWKQLQTLHSNGNARCLAYSPDGQRLAWGTTNAVVQVWNPATGEIQTLRGHLKVVVDVAFSPDGNFIASASQDGTAKIWAVPVSQLDMEDEREKTEPVTNEQLVPRAGD